MSETVQPFEAEVGRVLDLVINSLYKDREIFLRELISNASDACDKLRYRSLTEPELLGSETELKIAITADPDSGLLIVSDNGIGMDDAELSENLGTIARSGTVRFLEQASGNKEHDLSLIGQFGVGFYSVFMVADRVIVRSRKAGDEHGWLWASDGRQGFTVNEAPEQPSRGTSVTIHLKDDAKEFLSEWRLREVIRRYSDHIAFPIFLHVKAKAGDTKTKDEGPQQVNEANALWARPKSTITEEQYREFYHHVGHAFDEPFARLHFTAEGMLSYTALIYVPSMKPLDLYDPKRRHGVKLYVRRVFISSDLDELMPRYLRFVTGVVDSEDLQLNVSRETLQHGAVVAKMRRAIVKRLLDELARKASTSETAAPEAEAAAAAPAGDDAEAAADEPDEATTKHSYEQFWTDFGGVLKEGLYEDRENRDKLLELARFRSTRDDGWTSLAAYVERMKKGQDDILYISGENVSSLRNSPQLEVASAKGVEVLLLSDPVDEFWIPEITDYKGKPFKSLTKGNVDLEKVETGETGSKDDQEAAGPELDRLIARIKIALGDQVKDVRPSKRLRESAVCLVADEEGGMDMRLERFLKQHSQIDALSKRVLEINGQHPLIRRMSHIAQDDPEARDIDEISALLLDQARIIEGEPIPDPGAFSRRMSDFLARGMAG